MINERLEAALDWCKLKKFNREQKKKRSKKKRNRSLNKKEFKEMCKQAGVRKESLCKTIFTKDL